MLHIKIRNLRESYELTQKEVADLLNIERSTYSYYESGKSLPSISTIAKLSEFYSVSCDCLIKDEIKYEDMNNAGDLLNKICKREREFLCYFRMISIGAQNKIMDIMKTLLKKSDFYERL